MANTKTGAKGTPDPSLNYEEISVDTDPGEDGYASEAAGTNENGEAWFYIKSITGTVTLQWKKSEDSAWVDYEDYTAVTRKVIHDDAGKTVWRVIVKDNNQNAVAGINW